MMCSGGPQARAALGLDLEERRSGGRPAMVGGGELASSVDGGGSVAGSSVVGGGGSGLLFGADDESSAGSVTSSSVATVAAPLPDACVPPVLVDAVSDLPMATPKGAQGGRYHKWSAAVQKRTKMAHH